MKGRTKSVTASENRSVSLESCDPGDPAILNNLLSGKQCDDSWVRLPQRKPRTHKKLLILTLKTMGFNFNESAVGRYFKMTERKHHQHVKNLAYGLR